MIGFDIEKGKLIVRAEALTIKAFKVIWDSDSSVKKEKAHNLLSYVFHMCDLTQKNPFIDVPYDKREALAKKNDFGNKDYKFKSSDQEMIDEAFMWYDALQETALLRLGQACNRKIDEITEFLNDEENKITSSGNLDDTIKQMSSISKVLESKKKTDEYIRQEFEKVRSQGGLIKSPRQSGLLQRR